MMLRRLHYRVQIPLGLSLAVVITALLVTAVSAQISAIAANQATMATVDRAMALLSAQSRPLLAADDTWRLFVLLRNTAALLPGMKSNDSRAAILDAKGRVYAASNPEQLETGQQLLGTTVHRRLLPSAEQVQARLIVAGPDHAVTLLDPIHSEDGQLLGFVFVEVDGPVFAADWTALAKPAFIGAVLAVALLAPAGWLLGKRMARPIARIVQCIERIGHEEAATLKEKVPATDDPTLEPISDAVRQLLGEMEVRQKAEQRALSAERMAAIGRMTAAVAHEINNPLGGLLTATQTLKLHGESEVTRHKTVDLIDRGLQQIRSTVAALVPQARIEDRVLELNDLADVSTLVHPMASRSEVQVSTGSDIYAEILVPSAVMRQVMFNLLLNAIKAAGYQGWVRAVLKVDQQKVQFCVSNSGEQLSAIKLERTVASESGNDPRGFGLWVCQEIATQFGGGFEVVSSIDTLNWLVFWIPNREKHEVVTIN